MVERLPDPMIGVRAEQIPTALGDSGRGISSNRTVNF
jgi:hypothetical protein